MGIAFCIDISGVIEVHQELSVRKSKEADILADSNADLTDEASMSMKGQLAIMIIT
jgi:hypothetical protein